MIVQIRGTSGSGKTTAMRKIMERLPLEPTYINGRRNPIYYVGGGVAVLGSYSATCGGVDSIHSYDELQSLVRGLQDFNQYILMEGLLLSEDTKQTLIMNERLRTAHPDRNAGEMRVIFLNTPLETCLQRVQGRREAKGNDKPLNPLNTSKRVATINRARTRLETEGVKCFPLHPDQVPGVVLKWLGK